jgi:hypothetical protein
MKKAAVIAGFCLLAFLASTGTAEAGMRFSFGLSVGPAVPYDYFYYPAYPAPYDYRAYYVYPRYSRTIVVPRFYEKYRYSDRYYGDRRGRDHRDYGGKSNPRSRSRWKY